MIKLLYLSLRNLTRNIKRNLATGSAIAFGCAGILMLGAYNYRIDNLLRVFHVYVLHASHLSIFAPQGFEKFQYVPKKYSLNKEDQDLIINTLRQNPNVENFESQIRGSGLVGNGCMSYPFFAQGFEASKASYISDHPQVKKWIPPRNYYNKGKSFGNYNSKIGAVELSNGLARALGKFNVHDETLDRSINIVPCENVKKEVFSNDSNVQLLAGSWDGAMSAVDGEVVGLFSTGFQESDSGALTTSVDKLQELFATDHVSNIGVWIKDFHQLDETKKQLENSFKERNKNFEIISWNEERQSPYYVGTMEFLNTMVGFVGIILAVIVGFSVLNSTTMTVLERSQEIGMYRAMGFKKNQIVKLFIQESFCLSMISLCFGICLGIVTIKLINHAHIIYYPPGASGGINLMLILHWKFAVFTSFILLILSLFVTQISVIYNLRGNIGDLVGGIRR